MARPLRLHIPGALHHVISRANGGDALFRDDIDYRQYIELLGQAARRFGVVCESYCLMRTHVHLVLRPGAMSLSRLMHQLNSRYSQWFNRRHNRFGHLIGERFKAPFVDSESYFLRLIRYVLRNPVAAGAVTSAADWQWSSYRALATGVDPNRLVSIDRVWLALGISSPDHADRLLRGFLAEPEDDEFPEKGYIIGSQAFASRFDGALRPFRKNDDYVRSERFASRPPLQEILPPDDETKHQCGVKQAFFEWAYTLRDIARHLGRKTATIWRWIHRLRLKKRDVKRHAARTDGAGDPPASDHSARDRPDSGEAQGLVPARLETVTTTLEGCCFEWCTRFCAGTPCDSS